MTRLVSFWAGKKAYEKIMASGIRPDDVDVAAGAAGGPKWLVLGGLDRLLFGSWFDSRKTPLFLVGSSIGAWRFAAVSQKDPLGALNRFESAYLRQTYGPRPSMQSVNAQIESILEQMMGPDGPEQILSNPLLRLNILSVQCRGLTGSDTRSRLLAGLALAAAGNALFRGSLKLFFTRTLFYDPRDIPPFFDMADFPIHKIPLTRENIRSALMASGAIPMIMPGVKDIPGAPAGVYRDGGIIDYHLNIPFNTGDGRIVLFPHYTERVVPGWLDKQIFWRGPDLSYMESVLLAAPTAAFLESLPHGKIPDRTDFSKFNGSDRERMDYWRRVVGLSRALADDFMQAVDSGEIRNRLRPLSELSSGR